MTVDEARTLLALLQNSEQAFQSVGLAPPLLEPSHPDFVAAKALMQQIRQALSSGSTLDLPTE